MQSIGVGVGVRLMPPHFALEASVRKAEELSELLRIRLTGWRAALRKRISRPRAVHSFNFGRFGAANTPTIDQTARLALRDSSQAMISLSGQPTARIPSETGLGNAPVDIIA